MKLKTRKFTFAFLLICTTAFYSLAQNKSNSSSVKLIKWTAEDCDNTYDPYMLKNRISYKQTIGTSTFITVNFSDNCCAEFKPEILFSDNRLTLLPYKEDVGNCLCDCCFAIQFEISGLAGKEYEIYFKDKKVELSADYYDVVETKDSLYNGQKINRVNKYGFREGLWMDFYKTGEKERVSQYPEEAPYFESYPIWTKAYYKSGAPDYIQTTDTVQSWFEDGEIRSRFLKYKIGDTTYSIGIKKFDTRKIEKKYFRKSYPFYKENSEGYIEEIIYEEEYYPSGTPKYIYGTDTTYAWYENGQLEYKSYHSGKIKFTEDGHLIRKSFYWKERGPKNWQELEYYLSVEFYKNGNIKEIEFTRDEPSGRSLTIGVRYYWKWNSAKILTESPKKWKEEYPWKKFQEIDVLLKTYPLH